MSDTGAVVHRSVSIIVPALNAADTIEELADRLIGACSGPTRDLQVILVDDGSTDDTWAVIRRLAEREAVITGVRLSRNFGQTPAICAGIEESTGDVVATIDADMDTRPEDLPLLIAAIERGADLANGTREGRDWRRRLPSRLFNLRTRQMGYRYTDAGCGMVAMTRAIAVEAMRHGELRRSLKFKLLLDSLSSSMVEVRVPAGPHSRSKHRLADLVSAGLDAEVSFRRTTLMGAATAAAVLCGLAALAAVVMASLALATDDATYGWAAAILGVTSVITLQLSLFCIVSNLVLRTLDHLGTPFCTVAETCGGQERT